jgi:hypothetical protein
VRARYIATVLLLALGVAACGNTSQQSAAPQTTTTAVPEAPSGPTTLADIRAIVADGGELTAERTSVCALPRGIRKGKVVVVPGPGLCSIKARMVGTPAFGSEHEVFSPLFPIFKRLFAVARDPRNRPVGSVFISVVGPITTVGGKTKWDVVFNAQCSRAANGQIDWDNIDTDGFKQLCAVRKFVKF